MGWLFGKLAGQLELVAVIIGLWTVDYLIVCMPGIFISMLDDFWHVRLGCCGGGMLILQRKELDWPASYFGYRPFSHDVTHEIGAMFGGKRKLPMVQ